MCWHSFKFWGQNNEQNRKICFYSDYYAKEEEKHNLTKIYGSPKHIKYNKCLLH